MLSQNASLIRLEHVKPQPARRGQPANEDFAVFDDLYPRLRRFAAVVADLDMDPDDLVQDALVSTLSRHHLAELDNPAAYLKAAIVNAASSDRRRRGVFRRILPRVIADASFSDSYPSDIDVLAVLAPIDRAVVFLADVEGVPHRLIAEELGLTHSAVRKRVSRSRSELRRAMHPNLSMIPGDSQ